MVSGNLRPMRDWGILNQLRSRNDILALGLFGSSARGAESADVDVFVLLARGTEQDQLRTELLEAGFDPILVQEHELDLMDAIFLTAISRDMNMLKGRLELKTDPMAVEAELERYAVHHLLRLEDELSSSKLSGPVSLAAFNAARYACWLLLHRSGCPLPGNSEELLAFTEKVLPIRLWEMFRRSALSVIRRYFDSANAKLNKDALLYTVLSVREALALSRDPLADAERWIDHVNERIGAIAADDIVSIRELCQSLFMGIYSSTRAYIAARKGYAPEVHIEIFHTLSELKSIDPNAIRIEETYREAFDGLHVDCHYRGLGNLELIRGWARRARDHINYIKSVV